MGLYERLTKIAKLEGIDESSILKKQVDFFLHQHSTHGGYEILLGYYTSTNLSEIRLICSGLESSTNDCAHHDPRTDEDLKHIIIYYFKPPIVELNAQEEYRKKILKI